MADTMPWEDYKAPTDEGPWNDYKGGTAVAEPAAASKPTDAQRKALATSPMISPASGSDAESESEDAANVQRFMAQNPGKPAPFKIVPPGDVLAQKAEQAKMTPEDMKALGVPFPKIAAPIERGVAGAAAALGNPENLAYMTMPEGVVGKIVGDAFMGQMAVGATAQVAGGVKDIAKGDTGKGIEEITGGALGAALPAAHFRRILSAPDILPRAKQAAVEAISQSTEAAQPKAPVEASAATTPEAPTKAAESPTKPPKAPINVKESALEPQHQEMLDSEAKAGGHKVRVETGPIEAGHPMAGKIASIDRETGETVINPKELSQWLNNNVPKGQEKAAIRSVLGEEQVHQTVDDKTAKAYLDSTTAAEQAIAQRVYGGKGGEKLSPTMLGHEMLRMRMQQLARMGVRETIEASNKERWTVKSLLAVSDAIRTAREVIGTKASKEGGAITDRIQENLDAAIKARGGSAPGATAKGGVKDETESLLAMPIEDFSKEIKTRNGGLTGDAYRLGAEVKTPEDLQALQSARAKAGEEAQVYKKAMDFNKAIAAQMRAQYYREAYEAATGTESAGFSLRQKDPNFKFPAPEGKFEETPGAKRKGQDFSEFTADIARLNREEGELRERISQLVKSDKLKWEEAQSKGTEFKPDPELDKLDSRLREIKAERAPWLEKHQQELKSRDELPGAKRKEDRTPEFLLPPVESAQPRPTASELGALPEQKIPPEQALKADTVLWNKPNAWRRISSELLHKPFSLGKMLTEGSRATESDPVSATRRLVALEKNGKVDVVSVYPDAEDGARAVDPAYAGKRARPNVPIKALLEEGYKPLVSMLRTEAVQNFHRHFDSVDHFENTVGKPGDEQWKQVRGYEAPTANTQAPQLRQGAAITDNEAKMLYDHFKGHDTLEKAIEGFASSPGIQRIRSALTKAAWHVRQENPSLLNEEAFGIGLKQLYENAKANRVGDQFVQKTMGDFGEEGHEGALHTIEEHVNDLGKPPEAGEDAEPAAINKWAADQVKLTKDEIDDMVTKGAIGDRIARTADAAGNVPNILAAQEENGVRLQSADKPKGLAQRLGTQWKRGNKDVLGAANALVQSQFNKAAIPTYRAMVQKGITEANHWIQQGGWRQKRMGQAWLRSQNELMKELDYAEAHWNDPDLQATARRMKQSLDQQWSREKAAGFDVSKDPNYLPQRYDAAVWNEHSILFDAIAGTEKILGGKFRKPKSFPTYYDASAEGPYIPVTRDGASLVGHRVRQGMNLIQRDAWSNGLKSVRGPSGEPVAQDVKILANGQTTSPGRNYEVMKVGNKVMAIHDDFKGLIDDLSSPSKVENWPKTRAALRIAQGLKHGMLLGDFFHLGRMGYYAASIMGKDAGWKGGWSVLDIKPQDLNQAIAKGIISAEDANWGNRRIPYGRGTVTRRQLANQFVKQGANLGKIQDALYKDLITDMTPAAGPVRRGIQRLVDPSVGRYNRFLFDNLTRGLMTEANVREFERQSKANPNADPQRLIDDISRDVNNYFGNIGKQGWVKSATMKDLSRLLFLAPDWVEGLVKKEASFYGRASGVSKLAGRRQGVSNLGTTGRGIGRGLVFLAGLTQAINLITRRQPTWKNEEKGHKFDAWIPGFGKDSEGFWFSPLSIFNELSHDLWRYAQTDKTVLAAIDQIVGNKESPLMHAAIIGLVGAGAMGGKATTSMGQLKQAGQQLAPLPLTFGKLAQAGGHAIAPGVVPPVAPGAIQRQAFAAAGLKIEPKSSAVQEIGQRARDFAKENGFSKETGWQQVETDEPSYAKLRSALRNGDEAEAKRQYQALSKNRSDKQIFHAMKMSKNRPFTGSKKAEHEFIRSLSDKDLNLYYKALDQREKEYSAFQDFALRQ